jgi:cytochrome c553
MKPLALLLAAAAFQPQIPRGYITEPGYSELPTRVIYKSYPVYRPDREPAGYMDWLKQQEPQVSFDPAKFQTRADWIHGGELVFNAPTSYGPVFFSATDLRDSAFYQQTGMPVAADGSIPFAAWVIRRKGEVELGSMGCNTCHTRVVPDGKVVPGAQGNNPGDREGARILRLAAQAGDPAKVLERARGFARQFEMTDLPDDPNRRARTMSLEELIAAGDAIPPGVTARSGTSMFVPPQIPDLIGVRDRQLLDHTGFLPHRSPTDMMRYVAIVTDVTAHRKIRYSDEQLYALALYLYSLEPPKNPNQFDATAARGLKVFEREGCARCHTPPLYTNNERIPAAEIGTDARYTTQTHKATGYYKVPSLKGLWYRGRLEHNGRAASLEEWFDPQRKAPGHRFGLNLSGEEKEALIAYLRTL